MIAGKRANDAMNQIACQLWEHQVENEVEVFWPDIANSRKEMQLVASQSCDKLAEPSKKRKVVTSYPGILKCLCFLCLKWKRFKGV